MDKNTLIEVVAQLLYDTYESILGRRDAWDRLLERIENLYTDPEYPSVYEDIRDDCLQQAVVK